VNGVATLALPAPSNGSRSVSAEYTGDRRFHGSFSGSKEIEVVTTSVGVPDESPRRFGLGSVWPNPVGGDAASLRFELPTTAPVRVEVFDVHGRRRVARNMGTLEPGPHTVGLPDLDALTPGLYFVRLMQGERTAVGRFTRLKTPPN
jgi:hypothetical protein